MYPRPAPCPFYHIVSSVSPWSSDSLPLPPILSERLGAVCIGSSAISPHQKVNNNSSNSCSCLTWAAVADSWFYPAKFAPFLGPEPRAWEPAARAHKPGKEIFTVGRPAPPLKSWPWTTLLSCFSCCPSPLLPLAPSHCLASLLCVYLSPLHLTSGGCRLLQCFAAYLCEGRLELIMFNCVYLCLGDWGNFCSRSTASCGLHKATRDNVCPWANMCAWEGKPV